MNTIYRSVTAAAALALLLGTAACGSDESAGQSAPSAASSASEPSESPSAEASASDGAGLDQPSESATGFDVDPVLATRCEGFRSKLESGSKFGAVTLSQQLPNGCRFTSPGLADNSFFLMTKRQPDAPQANAQDLERMCDDVAQKRTKDPLSSRVKDQIKYTRSISALASRNFQVLVGEFKDKQQKDVGGLIVGCDSTYAYEARVLARAPLGLQPWTDAFLVGAGLNLG